MSSLMRLLSITLISVSMASGLILNQAPSNNQRLLKVATSSYNFDTMLAQGLTQIVNHQDHQGTATIIISYAGTQIIARVQLKDIKRLVTQQVTFDQFVREYVRFS